MATSTWVHSDLVFFGARCQLPALGIQLSKAAGDILHTGV